MGWLSTFWTCSNWEKSETCKIVRNWIGNKLLYFREKFNGLLHVLLNYEVVDCRWRWNSYLLNGRVEGAELADDPGVVAGRHAVGGCRLLAAHNWKRRSIITEQATAQKLGEKETAVQVRDALGPGEEPWQDSCSADSACVSWKCTAAGDRNPVCTPGIPHPGLFPTVFPLVTRKLAPLEFQPCRQPCRHSHSIPTLIWTCKY